MAYVTARGSALVVAFAGLIALAVAMGIGRFAFTPIQPMMQEDAGVSIAMGGWLASANYVGYLAGALSVIWWRIAATTGIRVGLATIGLGTLAMGLEHHFAAWLALRALAGVASAWVLIYVSAWCLENLASLGRPALGSTVYAGVGAGIVLAGALCLALMHVGAGSAHAWIVLGALAIVLSLGIWTVFRPRAGSPGAEAARSDPRAMAWHRPDHARRALGRRHIHGDHDGRHAGSARRRGRPRDRLDGGHDRGLRRRADRRADQRESRGGSRRQRLGRPRDRLCVPRRQRLRVDMTSTRSAKQGGLMPAYVIT